MTCGCAFCLSGNKSTSLKIRASVMAALLFVVIASPEVFGIVQKLFGGIARVTVNGVPTAFGLLLHGLVYGLLSYLLMGIKKKY